MSRLTDLIAQAKTKDAQLGADLEREFSALASRLPFGLNFERHRPEAVELPQRLVRKGDKVRVLPERGSTKKGDPRLWVVRKIVKEGDSKVAELESLDGEASQSKVALDDIVVVAEGSVRISVYEAVEDLSTAARDAVDNEGSALEFECRHCAYSSPSILRRDVYPRAARAGIVVLGLVRIQG